MTEALVDVRMSAKDAELLSAWQRQRDSLVEFGGALEKTHEKSHSWGEEFTKDLANWGKGLAASVVGFEAVRKVGEFVVDAYREEGRALKEVVDGQRKSREELTHMLALSGKLGQAPAVEAGLEDIKGATRAEKSAVFSAGVAAAPDLATDQVLALTKPIAPLAGVLGQQGASDTMGLAAKLKQSDPAKTASQAADMAVAARAEARARAGELSDPGAMRAFEILHNKAGMSSERALAFEAEALRHHLQTRGLEKLADALVEKQDIQKLPHKTREDMAKLRFYREHDAAKRLQILQSDEETRHAVLGEKEAEHLGQMSPQSITEREGRITAAQRGEGAAARLLKNFGDVEPLDANLRQARVEKEEGEEAHAKYTDEELFTVGQDKQASTHAKAFPDEGPVAKKLFDLTQSMDYWQHCRRRSKNVAPGRDRRGGRIVKRTFVQTLGPEQNGEFFPFPQEAVRHRSVRRHGDVE